VRAQDIRRGLGLMRGRAFLILGTLVGIMLVLVVASNPLKKHG
jgi:hypothetical protein